MKIPAVSTTMCLIGISDHHILCNHMYFSIIQILVSVLSNDKDFTWLISNVSVSMIP